MRVWRGAGVCVVRTHVALARVGVCVQDMTRAHVKMNCKERNGTFHVYYPSVIVCCSNAFVCNQCIGV